MRLRALSTFAICGMLAAVWTQSNPQRPNIQWQIGATGAFHPISFTYDSKYVAVTDGNLILVYNMYDAVRSNAQLAQSLASWTGIPHVWYSTHFTYPFADGTEYLITRSSQQHELVVMRWRRDANAAYGGYIESRQFVTNPSPPTVLFPLRHNGNNDRNRLVVGFQSNNFLYLYRLEPEHSHTAAAKVISTPSAVRCAAYDPVSQTLATGHFDGLLRFWRVSLGTVGNPNDPPNVELLGMMPASSRVYPINSVGFYYPNGQNSSGILVASSLHDGVSVQLLGYNWQNGTASTVPQWQTTVNYNHSSSPLTYQHGNGASNAEPGDRWIPIAGLWIDAENGKVSYTSFPSSAGPRLRLPVISPQPIDGRRYLLGNYVDYNHYAYCAVQFIPYELYPTRPIPRLWGLTGMITVLDATQHHNRTWLAVAVQNAQMQRNQIHFYSRAGSNWSYESQISSAFNNAIFAFGAEHWFAHSAPRRVQVWSHQNLLEVFGLDDRRLYFGNQFTANISNRLVNSQNQPIEMDWYDGVAWRVNQSEVRVALLGVDSSGDGYLIVARNTSPLNQGSAFVEFARVQIGANAAETPLRIQRVLNSSDVIVLSKNNVLRRFNAQSNYQQAWRVGTSEQINEAATIAVNNQYIWVYSGNGCTPECFDIANGARLAVPNCFVGSYDGIALYPRAASSPTPLANEVAAGVVDGGAVYPGRFAVMRHRPVNSRTGGFLTTGSTSFDSFLSPLVSDEVWGLAQDPGAPNWFIAGCADGNLYYVYAPPSTPTRALGYNGIGGNFFQAFNDDLLVFTTTPLDAVTPFWASYGWRELRTYRLTTGSELQSYRMPGLAPSLGKEAMVRYSPSGERLFGYEFGRFSLWDGVNPNAPLSVVNDYYRTDLLPLDNTRWLAPEFTFESQFVSNNATYYVYAVRVFQDTVQGNTVQTLSNFTPKDPATQKPMYGSVITSGVASDRGFYRTRIDLTRNQEYLLIRSPRLQWSGNQASGIGQSASLWRRTGAGWGDGDWQLVAEFRSGVNLPNGVNPTMVRFHPYSPNVFYLGLDNGTMRAYRIENGTVANLNSPLVFQPTLGNLGAVTVMDIAQFTQSGINYTVMAMGGPRGLSVYTGSACRLSADDIYEARFYAIDVGFPQSQNNSIWLQQPSPTEPPYAIYGNGSVLSIAKLDNLPIITCPEDTNSDGIINDADLLAVLFEFGSNCYCPADINCDGIVDDADLLLVLFRFGDTCGQN